MKRFIRYLYEYDNGKRVRNVGFVKVESEGDRCTLNIYGKGLHLQSLKDVELYVFYRQDDKYIGILQGKVEHINPTINYRLQLTPSDVGGEDKFGQIQGIILSNYSRPKYAAVWNDMPIDIQAVELREKPMNTGEQRWQNHGLEPTSPEEPSMSEEAMPKEQNGHHQMHSGMENQPRSEAETMPNQSRPGTGMVPPQSRPRTGTVPTQPQTGTGTLPTQSRTGAGTLPTQPRTGAGTLPTQPRTGMETMPTQPQTGTGTLPTQPRMGTGTLPTQPRTGTGTLPTQPQTGTGTLPTQPRTGAGTMPTQPRTGTGTLPTQPRTGTGTLPTQPRTGTGRMPTQPRTGAGTMPTQPRTGTGTLPTQPRSGMGSQPRQQHPGTGAMPTQLRPGMEATPAQTRSGMKATPSQPRSGMEATPSQPRPSSGTMPPQTDVERMTDLMYSKMGEKAGQSYTEEENMPKQSSPEMRTDLERRHMETGTMSGQSHMTMEATPTEEIGQNVDTGVTESIADAEGGAGDVSAAAESGVDNMEMQRKSRYNYKKIKREELAVLPRREWRLANNSFLLHGYNNYHHLLLIEEEPHLWLGVPGIYHEEEKTAAQSFGFDQFITTEEVGIPLTEDESEQDDFGYWCRQVSRNPV